MNELSTHLWVWAKKEVKHPHPQEGKTYSATTMEIFTAMIEHVIGYLKTSQ